MWDALSHFFRRNTMSFKKLIAIALQFKKGQQSQQDAATALRKACRNREAAKAAMMPAIAKAYGAELSETKAGNVRWVKGNKASDAAKRALNRLLALAYPGKATKRPKVDAVVVLLRKFGKLSAAQQRRFLKAAK